MSGLILEAFPCRDSTQLLAGSRRRSSNFKPRALRNSGVLEAYIAGSSNWKLSLAGSSNCYLLQYARFRVLHCQSCQLVMEYHKKLFNLIGVRCQRRDYRRSFRRRMAVDS